MKLQSQRRLGRWIVLGSFAAARLAGPAWLPPVPTQQDSWRVFDPSLVPDWLAKRGGQTHFSDVPTFRADEVSDRLEDASWAQRPFIIRENPKLLARQKGLEKGVLVAAALQKGLQVGVGYSWSIAQNRGTGPQKVRLVDFLLQGMHEALQDGEAALEAAYAFDRDFGIPGMPNTSDLHPSMRSWSPNAFDVPENAICIHMLGGPGSAAGWHSHGETVQMTVFGRKRWFIYPPGKYPPGDGPGGCFSLTDWLQIIYPTLEPEDKPLECMVGPGDLIHIPDGWYHAVVNLADTVASSVQRADMAPEQQQRFKGMSLEAVRCLEKESPADLRELEEAARTYVKKGVMNDLHARRVLYYCLMEKDPEEAVQVILDGTARDPFHVPTQFELASWLERRIKAGDKDALGIFRRAMEQWEPFLVLNTRNLKALWILSKYHRALGDNATADKFHERLVRLHELGIDR